jgi:hypothetical protein
VHTFLRQRRLQPDPCVHDGARCCCCRNNLTYRRSIVVRRFLVVDNGSTDGSRGFLIAQSDCHLFLRRCSDADSHYGLMAWRGRGTSRESRAYYIETVRREHWDGASEYARYLAKLKTNPSLRFHYRGSVEYEGREQLISSGLLPEDQRWMRIRTAARDADPYCSKGYGGCYGRGDEPGGRLGLSSSRSDVRNGCHLYI